MPGQYPQPMKALAALLSETNWNTARSAISLTTPYPSVSSVVDTDRPRPRVSDRTPAATGHDSVLLAGLEGGGRLRSQPLEFEDYEHPVDIIIRTDVDQDRLDQLYWIVAKILKTYARSPGTGYDHVNWDGAPKNLSRGGLWKYSWVVRLSADYRSA